MDPFRQKRLREIADELVGSSSFPYSNEEAQRLGFKDADDMRCFIGIEYQVECCSHCGWYTDEFTYDDMCDIVCDDCTVE